MNAQKGFSLFEVILTLSIASVLMLMIMQHYLVIKRQHSKVQIALENSFDLNLVVDLLKISLANTGFTPCRNLSSLKTVDQRIGVQQKLVSFKIEKESLTLGKMGNHFVQVKQFNNSTEIIIPAIANVAKTIILADCYQAEVQQIISTKAVQNGLQLTLAKPIFFQYSQPAYLGEWEEESFFMQKNQKGTSALFYKLDHSEELTSLVKAFTVHLVGESKALARIVFRLKDKSQRIIEGRIGRG